MQEEVYKRKLAKQQGSTGDDASSVSSLPNMPDRVREAAATASLGPKLYPIDKLRMDPEKKKSYSVTETEAASNEMWDWNLLYDRSLENENELSFLKRSKHSDTIASKTEALSYWMARILWPQQWHPPWKAWASLVLQKDQKNIIFSPASDDAPFLTTIISSIKAALTPNLNLVTKLQLTANYENLHDAVNATTQWAIQAR